MREKPKEEEFLAYERRLPKRAKKAKISSNLHATSERVICRHQNEDKIQ